jgi:signal transduction histidine kinase/GAF domain-containing protein/DNA-binding NarL/FixJ family response regulator/HPt (histidine-containing phosphotransfer) domain-containing protein
MKNNENADLSGRRAAIVEALNKSIEIFSVNKEDTFEEVMTNGIRPFANAVGIDRVVFYKQVNAKWGKRLDQAYCWDKSEDGLITLAERMKILPNHPVLGKWISITSNGGFVRFRKSDYTEDVAALLSNYGILSILIIPIFSHGDFWGVINFQDHTNDRYFDEDCLDLLYSAAHIFSNAIIKEEMRRRTEMEAALNRAAIIFFSQREETFEATMTAGIREIADAFNLDRFSIWRNTQKPDGLYGGQIYRWDRESGGTTVPLKGLEDMSYAKTAPRWESLLAADNIINSPVRLLPEAALLKSFGCVSALIKPLFFFNIFWGFALLEDLHNERFFEDDFIDMVRSVAYMCANTVIHADMEREIVDANEFNSAVLDASPLGFTIFDENTRVIGCNDSIAKLLKTTKNYYIEHFGEFSPEYQNDGIKSIDKASELVKRALNGEKLVFEWVHCTSSGEFIHNEVTLARAMYKGKYAVLGYQYDLHDRKKREMELAQARESAENANRAKSTFLANMSHELRTPLNVIIGLTNLILEDEHMDKHLTDNLIKINNAGTTLLSIVNDILDFSKIESGKLTLSPVEYYTSSLLNDIVTLTVTRLGEKPIQFHLDITDDLPNKLYGDDLRIKQVLTNLLTNAIKYSQQGHIVLKVRSARESDSVWVDFAVSDTGMGMTKDNIKHLFSDYYQVDDKANRYIEGTGLGLAITKKLVEMMEGQINVESERGKGSTFSFRLKQGFVVDTVLGADVSEKLRNFSYTDNKRIITQKLVRVNLDYAKVLVVDDMQTNLDVASGILRKYKMQVDILDNGQSAIDRVGAGTPVYDVIFMDHMMPGMDGIETADRIRALGTEYAKKVPIIALTANAIYGTDKMFYAHGFQDFITKPIDVMEMDAILRKWVYNKNRESADVSVASDSSSSEVSEEKEIVIEIPGVDTKKGLSLYVGDTDIYLPLLRSYVANTPGALEKLRNVSAENLQSYVITVHGLKGTSAGIGAEEIRAAALELENLSRAGDLQGILAKNGKLIADTEVLVSNVKAWLEQYDAQNAKPRMKTPDRELLAKLRQCCENYNMSGIDEVMSELDKTDYEEDTDLIAWIKEKIVISEIGEVAQRLAQY